MEMGVRLVGVLLRILDLLLWPWFWVRGVFAPNHDSRLRVTQPLFLKSATDLAAEIRSGELTSESVVSAYIERIKLVNPVLNAVADERYRAAIQEARAVDRRMRETRDRYHLVNTQPLLGVPFTVKESCSLEGMTNTVGCVELAGRRAVSDGAAVRLVREAGGIPLLVTNTPELCLGWETTNQLRGTTNNPYDLTRTPGGSSGGEAALLACGASPVGVASDIAGSIRLPAAFCGLFGHKPTSGVIPIEGHIPTLSDPAFMRYLAVGPMARKAEDLTLLTTIMAGENRHKLRLDEPVDLTQLKVLYMTEATTSPALLEVSPCIKRAIRDAVVYLHSQCGATVSQEKFVDLEDSVETSISLFFSMENIPNMLQDPHDPKRDRSLLVELARLMCGGGTRSLQALCFTLIHRTRLFIPDSRKPYYKEKARKLREDFTRILGDSGVLLYPVFADVAHRHNQVFVKASGVLYTMIYNILGLPATTVPMGLHRGLPVSIQVIAAPYQDRLCLAVANQLEVGFGGWRPPP